MPNPALMHVCVDLESLRCDYRRPDFQEFLLTSVRGNSIEVDVRGFLSFAKMEDKVALKSCLD